jgi:fatty-acyl-CoA synthase
MQPQSYSSGSGGPPLRGLTVPAVLDSAARCWPDKEALVVVDRDIRWSWRELRDRARAFAAGSLASGLEPGDRVGMLATNRAEWLVVQFGTAYAGLILVNINPGYRAAELEYALNKAGCKALITEHAFKTSDYLGMLQTLAPELKTAAPGRLRAQRLPLLRLIVQLGETWSPGTATIAEVMQRVNDDDLCRVDEIVARTDFDAPVNIQFTSGTTGAPKAATLTHHNMINNAQLSAAIMKFGPGERLLIALATLESERCTAVHGVPTMFIAMLDEPGFNNYDLSALRTGIMAGAPCPIELMKAVIEEMHMSEITIGYGMTETGPLSTQTLPEDPMELRVGTVGRVLPHTEIKIVDEQGRIVPRGEPGELCVRGYNVMAGYWGEDDGAGDGADACGWMHSGDIATLDEAGYVRIVGRSKDMLIRGGENVYPREIEEFLYTNPKIDQVEVVGVPDPNFGEEIAACVRLRDGETATVDEIRAYCKGRLAHFKVPRYVFFVDGFPMTVTGKVQKFLLREQLARELEKAS